MTIDSFYLICFGVGLILSVMSVVGGLAHIHIGRFHVGHIAHTTHGANGSSHGLSAINGFTITAFLCWFGGAGYLLHRYSIFVAPAVLFLSLLSGIAGSTLLWAVLFKVLLPRERILSVEETDMIGVLAHVSGSIRNGGGIGEILFSQTGARRCSAARSEDGRSIERGAEVVVMRYERGVAYVRRFEELADGAANNLSNAS
jgi:hypothetical protein